MNQNIKFIGLLFYLFISINLFSQIDTVTVEEILVEDKQLNSLVQHKVLRNEIVNNIPHDVGDLFSEIPGFGIIKRGNFAMEPVLRSFRYDQINLQFDGVVRVHNACPNRMDPITVHVNPNEIEQVEIIKGPYSVRFGPTMGGIINLVVTRPIYNSDKLYSGRFETYYETNGNNITTRFMSGLVEKDWNFIVNAGIKDYNNYKNGEGDEIPSSFKVYDYSMKLGILPVKNHKLQINFRQNYARDVLHAGLAMDADEDNSSILNLDYSIMNLSSRIFRADLKLYASDVNHIMSNSLRPNFQFSEAISTVESESLGGKLEFGIIPFEKMIMYAGIDFSRLYKDGVRERRIHVNTCTSQLFFPAIQKIDLIWQDSRLNNSGVFSELKYTYNDKLSFNVGARFDVVNSDILNPAIDFLELYENNIQNETEKLFSSTLSINYIYSDKVIFQLAMGRGSRPASILERYINHFSVGMDSYEYVGNPLLVAEKNNQMDLSVQYKYEELELSGTIFYSLISDFITAAVDSGISRKFLPCNDPIYAKRFQNIDKARQSGFEVSGVYHFTDKLLSYSDISYTYAKNITWDEPLPEIPPLVFHTGVRYSSKNLSCEINLMYSHEQDRVSESFDEAETDSYKVLNLRLKYSFLKNFEINFSVLNIFDETYYDHLSRSYRNMGIQNMYYEPGRNFLFGIKAVI